MGAAAGGMLKTIVVEIEAHTQDIAAERGETLSAALGRIVERARRARIFHYANEAYAVIAADSVENGLWRAEIAAWDCTLSDGLETESWNDVDPDSAVVNRYER